jgi:hypothetical protein
MIHEYTMDGLRVQTGDLICTTDGGGADLKGQYWRLIGKLIPGDVDHIVVYVGPGGLCVEAGATGKVISFEVRGPHWDAAGMLEQRGFLDVLYGVAYPLAGKGFSATREAEIREEVANYCLAQARSGKPYNLNFLDSSTEEAFYCSQLAYAAYLRQGIDLNTGQGVPKIPGTESIVFPQEIWSGCEHKRATGCAGASAGR